MRFGVMRAICLVLLWASPPGAHSDCGEIIEHGAPVPSPARLHLAQRVTVVCSAAWVTLVQSRILIASAGDGTAETVLWFEEGTDIPSRVSVRWDGGGRVIVSVPDIAGIGGVRASAGGVQVAVEGP